MMDFRNAIYNEFGGIDCEIDHPDLGWIPHTIDPVRSPQLLEDAALVAGPYVPPVAVDPASDEALAAAREVMSLTFSQLLIGLVAEGWITQAEGEAWLVGTLPASVTALISTLGASEQFAAKARAARPSIILRLDSLVGALAASESKTDAEIDTFFLTYAAV